MALILRRKCLNFVYFHERITHSQLWTEAGVLIKKKKLLTEAERVLLIIWSVGKSGNSGKCFQSALEYNGIILLYSPVKSLEFPRYSFACSGIPDSM